MISFEASKKAVYSALVDDRASNLDFYGESTINGNPNQYCYVIVILTI